MDEERAIELIKTVRMIAHITTVISDDDVKELLKQLDEEISTRERLYGIFINIDSVFGKLPKALKCIREIANAIKIIKDSLPELSEALKYEGIEKMRTS